MNKETKKVLKYIDNNPEIEQKLKTLGKKFNNFKDFYNQTGYVIMDIVNRNKEFYTLDRTRIDIYTVSERYFG